MRLAWVILSLILLAHIDVSTSIEDNEFAEFEDDESASKTELPPIKGTPAPEEEFVEEEIVVKKKEEFDDDDDDFGVEGEDDELDDGTVPSLGKDDASSNPDGIKAQPLKFADVPAHFRSNWSSYQVEALVLAILSIYMLNYLAGRASNQAIAFSWVADMRELLEEQFSVVGDDGLSDAPTTGQLQRDTDSVFGLWCTGRAGVNGCLINVRTVKRHDLVSRIWGYFTRQTDRITMTFDVEPNELDTYVLALGQRKPANRLYKELLDVSQFTVEKKVGSLPASFSLFAESSEATQCLLDPAVVGLLKKYEHLVEYIHISDQFTGPKPPDGETLTRLPEPKRVMAFAFVLEKQDEEGKQAQEELLQMVFYLLDKMRRFKLSREAKTKADKRRQAVQEAFLKTNHQARQEAAQARREEKTRERKQRLLDEEDPEKQRRLEKMEFKREQKNKQPKIKQLKMK